MLSTFQNLEKILRQEKKLGCQNKAVIGGLELFAKNWFPQALKEATSKSQRLTIEQLAVTLQNYDQHETPEEREAVIDDMLQQLAEQQSAPTEDEDAHETAPAEASTPSDESSETEVSSPPEATSTQNESSGGEATPETAKPAPPKQAAKPDSQPAEPKQPISLDGLDAPITRLPGIKSGNAKKMERLDVSTIGDLLTLYPRRYDDYRTLKTINHLAPNEDVTIIAQIWQSSKRQPRPNMTITTAILSDGTGTIEATWFNQPWLLKRLTSGKQIVVSGTVGQYLGRLVFQSPEWEPLDKTLVHTGRLVPIYPLTSGITAHWLRSLQKKTIDYWGPRLPDPLPEERRSRLDLLSTQDAMREIHFPASWESLETARRRLAFDELLLIQLGVFKQRQLWKAQQGHPIETDRSVVDTFIDKLPFTLTDAQKRALEEILADMNHTAPMSRLLQGDVGSGKTVVALAAMLTAIANDGQAAILAPTAILAEQHHQSMSALLEAAGYSDQVNIQLLTSATKTSDRNQILTNLANGQIKLLVGTHAIIQEDVQFQNLRLTVVDEQHRFGVEQRNQLREKGTHPHMLVMTATPIPRSLALTVYGDLDLSIIDEMPAGRQTIQTRWLAHAERERAYAFLKGQIEKGRQAFIICPLVEESDKIEAKSAVEEHERLQKEVFPGLKLGLLHGRMKNAEKEQVMADFRDKTLDILVSTSVVEVGIDIPNASTILIEGANRFGLAQLHQFRGRVGRGEHKSFCLLLADSAGTEATARLKIMEQTNNGFELAEEDLKIRGPGEFFGTRQSGLPNLKMVKLSDTKLLELARTEARAIFDEDPALEKPEHELLAKSLARFWSEMAGAN